MPWALELGIGKPTVKLCRDHMKLEVQGLGS